jgi:hypothetical protein
MRFITPVVLLFLAACAGKSNKEKETSSTKDSLAVSPVAADTTKQQMVHIDSQTREQSLVNASLAGSKQNWTVLNDNTAHWIKDEFDYFIAPKRKEDPNYPYIAFGDYNADGKTDTAAVVTDSTHKNYRIAILLGNEIKFWDEDIGEDAAINTLPKPGEIKGMAEGDIEKTKIVKTKGDGIEVNYFEKASFVLYWNGKSFKRIQTSD